MGLRRELGLLDIFCLATGAMVSSGIFVLPGLAHAEAGPSVILSYLLAGLLTGIGMLSTAELATAMPKAGGDYFFITRTLGPLPGSISGLLNWFSLSLKSAFALVGMAAFVQLFLPIDPRVSGVMLCLLFVGVNMAGTRHAGRLQVIFVLGLIALMLFYVVRGIPHVAMENLTPFTPYGIHRTLATAGFVFVAYGGLIQISGVAEEVRDPSRVIPRGIALSLIVVTILYVLMVWVTSGVLPAGQLDGSRTPITDGAAMFMAPWGVRLIGVAAILAFVSTANAGILSSSRYLYALSRDELLPPGLARLLPKTGVPFIAVIVTGLFISAALFLPLTILVESASLVLLLGFMMACICVIVLRESKVQNYRPSYAAPFYPFLQILGLLGYGLLLVELGIEAYVICAILFVVGFAVYQFYGRHRLAQDYALLHLVERITSKAFASGTLEQELKVIIRERDEIQTDRFDDVVAHALVLDLEKDLNLAEALDKAAEELSERLSLSAENLKSRFAAREAESSTVLTPFLAIPHIIIPGEHEFQIALVRARAGIRVEGTDERVHALFALVGTRDERNFHLLTLANLAQIVQDPQFEKRWLAARGEQGIRDVILLAKRQRAQTIKSEAF